MRLTAKEIQGMICAMDYEIVAHGYTLSRTALNIWFAENEIFRLESKDGKALVLWDSLHFQSSYFTENVKHWYYGDGRKFNIKLMGLFLTFGNDSILYPRRILSRIQRTPMLLHSHITQL